ncbi:MAG TPA: sigma-54 dependent transcriptional regulator [Oceanipulchritudo sp.]|nr:sigma-54 dependent transcriptional regulator [Oceanipulchritudo sp.]
MAIEKILIVDDEMIIRRAFQEYCQRKRIKVKPVGTVEEALQALEGDHGFDVMFLDIHLPDGDGTEILEETEGDANAPLAVMITGQGTIESAVRCMQLGAYDYILKPFSTEQIDLVIQRASKLNRLMQVNKALTHDTVVGEMELIGDSGPMHKLRDLIACVARTDATVMVHGETGTGKELIAQSIHQSSLRRDKPFIKVNCAAVSESLIESEFFGHEKGAFTGAMQSRIGRFELADGGTLLLDEISEISLALQAKLLRVLQEKEFERVGGTRTIQVDVRIIATTNRDLSKSIDAGEFRQDLYYRLNVFPLQSPALRERKGDIPLLARHFLKAFARKNGRSLEGFGPQAEALLNRHDWPGNVRELQNVIERAVILSTSGKQVTAAALPLEIQVLAEEGELEAAPESTDVAPADTVPAAAPESNGAGDPEAAEPVLAGEQQVEEQTDGSIEGMERRLILQTLQRTGGNRTRAAEILKVSIRTLFNKLKLYQEKGYAEFEPYFNK